MKLLTRRVLLGGSLGTVWQIMSPRSLHAQATAPERRDDSTRFTQLATGVLTTTHFKTDSLPGYRTEVTDLLVGPHQTAPDVRLNGFALMEMRAGEVDITIDGKPEHRKEGDFWFVPRGARIAIRNVSELAAIRTTVFIPR